MKKVGSSSSSSSSFLIKMAGSSSSSSCSNSSSQQQPVIGSSEEPCRKINYKNNKDLSEDILIEIFLYLPLKSIFKNKCVSKVWRLLLSNPIFLNRWMKFNSLTLSSLWILIFNWTSPTDHKLANHAYLDLQSQFISSHDGFSFEFVLPKPNFQYIKNEFEEDKLHFLGSSNGLVLCTTSLVKQMVYYVCNPLTKKWVSLPAPRNRYGELSDYIWLAHGFFCESSSSSFLAGSTASNTTTYKVVRIPSFKELETKFDVEIFSSDLGEWKTYQVSCPEEVAFLLPSYSSLITHDGVLYWIEGLNRLIVFDLNDNNMYETGVHQCRLMYLPEQEILDKRSYRLRCDTQYHRWLGVSEGLLCFAIFGIDKTLNVWVLEEDWHLVHKNIELNNILAEVDSRFTNLTNGVDSFELTQIVAFNPVDRNVVILGFHNYIFAYNIQTRTYEELLPPSPPSYVPRRISINHKGLPSILNPKPTVIPPPSWKDIPKGLEFFRPFFERSEKRKAKIQ